MSPNPFRILFGYAAPTAEIYTLSLHDALPISAATSASAATAITAAAATHAGRATAAETTAASAAAATTAATASAPAGIGFLDRKGSKAHESAEHRHAKSTTAHITLPILCRWPT